MVSKNSHDNSVFHQIVCLQSVEKNQGWRANQHILHVEELQK